MMMMMMMMMQLLLLIVCVDCDYDNVDMVDDDDYYDAIVVVD